jgi:dihydrofolate reductase
MEKILYMATSLDGFISETDGSEEFLSSENWDKFTELAEEAGCFVVGRKTYEAVKKWDNHSYENIEADRIVLTNDTEYEVTDAYSKVTSVEEAIQTAKDSDSDLIVTGGSEVNQSFFEKEKIDRVILNIEPILIGQGTSILSDQSKNKLKFVGMSRNDSLITLEYLTE